MITLEKDMVDFRLVTKKFKKAYVCESTNQHKGALEVCKQGGGKFEILCYDSENNKTRVVADIIYLKEIKNA